MLGAVGCAVGVQGQAGRQQRCQRVKAPAYCTAAQHFQNDLKTPPALQLLTGGVPARRPATVRFSLSKVSHVGIVIVRGEEDYEFEVNGEARTKHRYAIRTRPSKEPLPSGNALPRAKRDDIPF